jgi:hypothetical protein
MPSNQRQSFILVPAEGPYVQQWCARGTILLGTRMPVVGLLQARRERKRGFQVPSEVVEDIVGEVCCLLLSLVLLPCPLRQGSSPSFYRPRRERITCMPHLFSYMGRCGAPRHRVGGRLVGPCRDLAIMAYLVSEQWQLRG